VPRLKSALNPCNPCAGAAPDSLTGAESSAAYDCIRPEMAAAYAKSGIQAALDYRSWRVYSRVPYLSFTHGQRYVMNYANAAAKAYGAFEKAGVMPEGSILAKDSFKVQGQGSVSVGPLFIMEKMAAGFSPATNDWRYSMILPDGRLYGATGGESDAKVQFCADCHLATDSDSMMFLPEDYRVE
jgi:hypothetical protein